MLRLLLVPIAFASTAVAGAPHIFETGNEFVRVCARADPKDIGECAGYTKAAADTFEYIRAARHLGSCIPPGLKPKDLASLTILRLKANPKDGDLAAEESIIFTLDQFCDDKRDTGSR